MKAASWRSWSRWLIVCSAVGALASTSGCVVEADDTIIIPLADLSIEWDIDGSINPNLCTIHDIGGFRVTLDGPEQYVVDNDCIGDEWAVDFQAIPEGIYDISLTAFDTADVEIITLDDTIDLVDTGAVDVVTMPFATGDFL